MRKLFIALALSAALSAAHAADMPTTRLNEQQVGQFEAAVRKTLTGLQVTVCNFTVSDTVFALGYENANEQESDAFILAVVLNLLRPLATTDDQIIRATSYAKGHKLVEVSATRGDLKSVYDGQLRGGEEERVQRLVATTLKEAGLTTAAPPPTPKSISAAKQSAPRPELVALIPAAKPISLSIISEEEVADKLLQALCQAKLENISIARDGCGGWIIGFENRTYRSDIDAMAEALRILGAMLPTAQVLLQVKRDDVLICELKLQMADYVAAQGETLAPAELARRWQVASNGLGKGLVPQPLLTGNSSYRKIDLSLRPAIEYQIGREDRWFVGNYFIIADADTTLAHGWHANLQSSTRLSSGVSSQLDQARLTKTGWLARNFLATGTFGKLQESTYGWYGEAQWDGQEDRVGLVGYSIAGSLRSFEDNQNHAFGYYEHEWGDMGLTARLGYGRFVNQEADGAVLSLRRRFGESVVIVEALRAQGGEEAINFKLSVPMGPRVAAAPSALRVRSATAFKIDYSSNLGLTGDYLQNGQDLASFRGEPTAPYVAGHPERLLGEVCQPMPADWPASPSLEGTTGLIRIPTAEVAADGTLQGGVTYMDRDHSRLAGAPSDAMPIFVSMGLLPNLEIVGKVTIFHDTRAFDWGFNTDRSFNVHYRLCKQSPHRPAIAIGAQDISFAAETQEIGKSEYIVSTWAAHRWRAHAGIGKDRLDGVFGGVNVDLTGNRRLQLLVDYDTQYVNAGVRGFVGNWLALDASLLGMSKLGGAVVFRTELR
jgi:hypothetical protein